jgi:AAA15 family ATPase/GTPase
MSPPRITSIQLSQFRSYAKADLALGTTTFLVGRNAAGKSNLLDGLEFISEIASEPITTLLVSGLC